jgi:hypothetical protein
MACWPTAWQLLQTPSCQQLLLQQQVVVLRGAGASVALGVRLCCTALPGMWVCSQHQSSSTFRS